MKHLIVDVPTDEVHLYPISDVQVGASGVATEQFAAHIAEAKKDPLAMFFGGGDYTDSLSPSNRKHLKAAFLRGDLYDTPEKMLEEKGREHAAEFLELVAGTEGRWNFLLKGHHLNEYKVQNPDGTHTIRTTDHDIADALGAPYLGEPGEKIGQALISYRFPAFVAGRKRPVMRMFAMHGQGGGGTWGAPLNQLEKMSKGFNAHIYYVAHHHKLLSGATVKLHEGPEATTRLKATDSRVVAGGSWLRGYIPDEITYAEDGVMPPLAIGAPVIYINAIKDGTFRIKVLT